jgi:hypothetical protein
VKKLFILVLTCLILTACGGNESVSKEKSDLTIDEYENRVEQALKEAGDKTNLEILSSKEIEENVHAIALSDKAAIFLDTNNNGKVYKAALSVDPSVQITSNDDFNFAFELLIGTADDELTLGDRTKLRQDLGLYDDKTFSEKTVNVKKHNDITFTFKSNPSEIYILDAEF